MTEVNGQPVMDFTITMDYRETYGSFTVPGGVGHRPGDRIVITGHGSPVAGVVTRVRWSPSVSEVEWTTSPLQLSATEIIDTAARELAERHPA